jgi:hypothetical protein
MQVGQMHSLSKLEIDASENYVSLTSRLKKERLKQVVS